MSHEKCLFIRKNDMSKGNEFSQILNSIIKDQQSETDLSWTQDLEIETFHIHFATKTNEQSDEKKINSSIRNTPYFRVGLNKSF
ncbi:MAG: hypothetical protein KDD29_11470, partial [Flavobacteriales bacterium]|nr:hypothetical protein [Flavobacteriales bacterium]